MKRGAISCRNRIDTPSDLHSKREILPVERNVTNVYGRDNRSRIIALWLVG